MRTVGTAAKIPGNFLTRSVYSMSGADGQVLQGSSGVQVRLRSLPTLPSGYSTEGPAASRIATHARARLNYAQWIQRVQTGGLSDVTTTLPPPRARA